MTMQETLLEIREAAGRFVFQHVINPKTLGTLRQKPFTRDYSHGFYYDELFSGNGTDVKAILELCRDTKMEILDVGGGGGRLSIPLAVAGHNVTCLDNSVDMLKIAEERKNRSGVPLKNLSLLHQDVCHLALSKTYDRVFSLNYLLEHLADDNSVIRALKGIHDCLKGTGRFFCEVHFSRQVHHEPGWKENKWLFEREARIGKKRFRIWSRTREGTTQDGVLCEHAIADPLLSFIFLTTPLRILTPSRWESLFTIAGFRVMNRWKDWKFHTLTAESPKLVFELAQNDAPPSR